MWSTMIQIPPRIQNPAFKFWRALLGQSERKICISHFMRSTPLLSKSRVVAIPTKFTGPSLESKLGRSLYSTGEPQGQPEGQSKIENPPRTFKDQKICIDGIDLNVREEGEGSHNVLCLPGLLGTLETDFDKIFDEIDRSKFRLISWDPPGQGKSRPPSRNFEGDYFSRDAHLVAKLMEKLGYKKYSVIGPTNGGITGCVLAAEYPDRIENLTIWGLQAFIDDDYVKGAVERGDTKNWDEATLSKMVEIYGKEYLEQMLASWVKSVQDSQKSREFAKLQLKWSDIQCPTLIIQGHMDQLATTAHAQYYADNIKYSLMHVIIEGSHDLHLTQMHQFLFLVHCFLLDANNYFLGR